MLAWHPKCYVGGGLLYEADNPIDWSRADSRAWCLSGVKARIRARSAACAARRAISARTAARLVVKLAASAPPTARDAATFCSSVIIIVGKIV